MSKINLTFKGKNYSIDKSLLAGAIGELEAHLGGLNTPDVPQLYAGLYDENDNLAASWDELVSTGILTVSGGEITKCNDTSISGKLVAPNSVTSVGKSAFFLCDRLASVNLPVATNIGEHAFGHCCALMKVNLPAVQNTDHGAFIYCTSLTSVNLPGATSISDSTFYHCDALTRVDLPSATSIIGESTFVRCENLSTLIIRNENSVCELNFAAIVGTGILTYDGVPTGNGFLYVPAKFYADYLAMATMQAAYLLTQQGMGEAEAQATAEYIAMAILRKIEDYPEICDPDFEVVTNYTREDINNASGRLMAIGATDPTVCCSRTQR